MRKKGGRKMYNVGEENCDESSSSDDDYTFCVSTVSKKLPQVDIEINEIKVRMVIDTGATCNILCESDYNKLKVRPKLEKCRSKVSRYGNDSAIPIIGECQLEMKFKKKIMCRRFVIAAGNAG